MALKRTTHWATREYDTHLRQHAQTRFAWGSHDCCISAANAIRSFTGVDIADQFRGKYHDEATAFALIKNLTGGSTVADAAAYCANRHGLVEYQHPLMAKRGDLVVAQNGQNLIAGTIHLNGKHVVSVGPKGLVLLPITSVVRAWAI